ncbi:MAG: hypothetical protein LBH54_02840 [Clostridiales bacterium]|nr:hypothetical protein [Clostridiales bacterium]
MNAVKCRARRRNSAFFYRERLRFASPAARRRLIRLTVSALYAPLRYSSVSRKGR